MAVTDTKPRTLSPAWALALVGTGPIWFAMFVGGCFYSRELDEALWIMSGLFWLALLAWGYGVLAAVEYLVFPRRRRWARALSLVLMLPAALGVGIGIETAVAPVRERAHAEQVRRDLRKYEVIVAQMRAQPPLPSEQPEVRKEGDLTYIVGIGQPLRVAFVQRGGFGGNYFTAIVYDPTGLVMRANQAKADVDKQNDPQLERDVRLFITPMRRAEPLGGHWYRCWFT
jgi:hypothetical protein